ncbi:MAG TPA: S-layer homology domain-containing protein [Symbiobacteriaceae bacterium]|nr:S-layer homology domain-containing protein [Symbiobacteriaceae bacterium]
MPFSDVAPGDWFAPSLERLEQAGIVNGYPDGTFRPQNTVTLAEMVKLLLTAAGYHEPTDTVPWYAGYARKAEELGLVEPGDGADYTAPVLRWQLARMFCRGLGLALLQWDEVVFADVSLAVKPWVDTVFDEYLMRGYVENRTRIFRPDRAVIRAEAAEVTVRFVDYQADSEGYRRSRAPSLVPGDRFLQPGFRVMEADATGVWASGDGGRSLFRSEDRGITWERLYDFDRTIQAIHLTPRGALFVSVSDLGWERNTDAELYRSTNGGRAFASVLRVESGYIRFWSLASDAAGFVYATEYGYKDLPDNARRIYRSSNDGAAWRVIATLPEAQGCHLHRILVDRHDPRRLFLSVGDGPNSRVLRSPDRGVTWELLVDGVNPTGACQFAGHITWGLDNTPRAGFVLTDPDTGAEVGAFEPPYPYYGSAYDLLLADGVLYTGLLSYFWESHWWDGSLWTSRDEGRTWDLWAVWPKQPGEGIGFYKFTRQGGDGYVYATLPLVEGGSVIPFEGTVRFPLL